MAEKLHTSVSVGTTTEVPRSRTQKETDELPKSPEGAEVVILSGIGQGRSYAVEGKLTIGRSPSADVWIPDESISREHATITRGPDGTYTLRDLDSRNGTLVNGVLVEKHVLNFGDKITIGSSTIMGFNLSDPMAAQLQQLQKLEAVGRLAGGVAHQFNNLLAVVVTNLSLLEIADDMDPLERSECIADAKQAALQGGELTRQMLDFSRYSNPVMEALDLSDLVRKNQQFIRRTFNPSIEITLETEPELAVRGDRIQLDQVLMNLSLNARDAVRNRGTIHLGVHRTEVDEQLCMELLRLKPGPHAVISVEDDGVGMARETLERVFEPFFTTKKIGQGTGLGLSVVLGLVHSHGGDIKIESELRKGTKVRVFLPLTRERPRTTEEIPTASEMTTMSGTVLVVDDEEMVLRSLSRTLRSFGLEVLTATDGKQGVQIFEQKRDEIDLVILDMVMPVLGGREAFAILKRLSPEVKVLILTGFADDQDMKQLMAAGVVGYLDKPYNPKELQHILQKALSGAESES
jgi:signal transduction histidine kinase/CheY-like chemotaxis protein